jgi:prepilin-type N-terminal cleavage/methylation domain-containing protein/prepilin-type processing-associated H-X9-DG protein
MKTRKGFTLIELLVVIAIIAILAAIVFPVFLSAKRAGQSAACLGNMKQLGAAFMLYSESNSGKFPLSNYQDFVAGSHKSRWGFDLTTWMDIVYPYVRNFGVFVCPARPLKSPPDLTAGQGLGAAWSWGRCSRPLGYGMNMYLESPVVGGAELNPDVGVRNASRKILLCEMTGALTHGGMWYIQMVGFAARDHGGRGNFVFCDGHAKSMKVTDTIVPQFMWNPYETYPFSVWPFGPVNVNSEKEAQDWSLAYLAAYGPR